MASDKLNPKLDLKFERVVNVPKEFLWKGWTDPKTMKKWFCPKPWKLADCKVDLRPGGIFYSVMQGPKGEKMECVASYVEVIKNKKLVWTNAMLPDFRPSAELKHPDFFMTAIISFEPQGKKTKYTAIVRHKNEADRKKHEEMRFHEGWGIALDQLVALYSNS